MSATPATTRPSRSVRRPGAVVALLAVTALLAACGSSSSTTATTTAAKSSSGSSGSSPADFTKKANAVCKSFNSEGDAVQSGSSKAAQVKQAQALIAIGNREIAALKALQPPAAIAAKWNKVIGDLPGVVTTLKGLEAKIKAGDQSGAATKSAELKAASKKIDAQFDALGAKTCGSGSSSSSSSDTADTSAADSSSTDTASADTAGTDTASTSGGIAGSAVCKEVPYIKEVTTIISDAQSSGDPAQLKKGIADAAAEFDIIAKAAPASLRSDAQFVATTWEQYSAAVDAVAPGDTAALNQVQSQYAGQLGSGPQVKALDDYLSQC